MEQPNSGDRLWLRSPNEAWYELGKAYLMEATTYEWRLEGRNEKRLPKLQFCGVPLIPIHYDERFIYGEVTMPFQSGQISFEIEGTVYETYLYADSRKMTQEQFDHMISDILKEASLCFKHSEVKIGIQADERSRELTLAQWSYINSSFSSLSSIVRGIMVLPIRMLRAKDQFVRRENVKNVDTRMMGWLERNLGRRSTGLIPEFVHSSVREETFDVYENAILKKWLLELRRLIDRYGEIHYLKNVSDQSKAYSDQIRGWLRSPFFRDMRPYEGMVSETQVFRKHPVYRLAYKWFDRLYTHGREQIGFDFHYPLQETFSLYEIWCYLQVVRLFREQGMLKDSSGLYRVTKEGCFLHLSQHGESVVKLKNGMQLFYQRAYRYNQNSRSFYTYTQEMIPDIVLETGNHIHILDPKYRVSGNLGMALGEMHKYRDGILNSETNERAVESVFILTPEPARNLRYFESEFHRKYGMGAIGLSPGGGRKALEEWLQRLNLNNEL